MPPTTTTPRNKPKAITGKSARKALPTPSTALKKGAAAIESVFADAGPFVTTALDPSSFLDDQEEKLSSSTSDIQDLGHLLQTIKRTAFSY